MKNIVQRKSANIETTQTIAHSSYFYHSSHFIEQTSAVPAHSERKGDRNEGTISVYMLIRPYIHAT